MMFVGICEFVIFRFLDYILFIFLYIFLILFFIIDFGYGD